MKSQKLISEFNGLLETIAESQHERNRVLGAYRSEVKKKEKKLLKNLKHTSNKTNQRTIRKELGLVKRAYALLES